MKKLKFGQNNLKSWKSSSMKKKSQQLKTEDRLLKRILSDINSSSNPLKVLYLFKKNSSLAELSKYFNEVISSKKIFSSNLRIHKLVQTEEANIHIEDSFIHKPMDLLRELVWTALTLNSYNSYLKDFYLKRDALENSLLLNDFEISLSLLDEIDRKYGKSLWSIKNRLNILQRKEGLDAQKAYAKTLKDSSISTSSKILIYLFSIGAEENISYDYYERITNKFFERFNIRSLFEYYKYKINAEYIPDEDLYISHILIHERTSSLVDMYETFLNLLSHIVCMNFKPTNELDVFIRIVRKMYKNVPDPRFVNILRMLDVYVPLTELEKNETILNIFDNFEQANYLEVIQESERILSKNPNYTSLYQPYLESIYILNEQISLDSNTLLYEILVKYQDMLTTNDNTQNAINDLFKLLVTYSNLSISNQILSILLNYLIDEKSYKSKVGYISTSIFNLFKHNIYSENIKEKYIQEYTTVYSSAPSLQLLINFNAKEESFLSFLENKHISERSKTTLLSLYYFTKKEYEHTAKIALNNVYTSDVILKNTVQTMFILSLLRQNKHIEAMKEVINTYFINKNTMAILPVIDIVDVIIENIEKTFKWPSEIDAPILFYLCTISRNHDTESRTEYLYEYYLVSHDYKRPTDLISDYINNQNGFDEKTIFYLDKICIPEIMKTSLYIDDYIDAEKERIKVCHHLISIDNKNEKRYLQEIKDREQNLFIKNESSRIEKNKIYVDIEGIKKSYSKELKNDYDRLMSLIETNSYQRDSEVEKIIDVLKNIPSEEKNVTYEEAINSLYISNISSNEIDDLFQKIIELSRDIFVKNEHYGLDVYLSTKIRHGTISNHLRKPLEKENIITLKNSKLNEYEENAYWSKLFYNLESSEITLIQSKLKNFSKRHDDIIKNLTNNLLQVTTSDHINTNMDGKIIENENKEALFKYNFTNIELKSIFYSFLDKDLDYDVFISNILQVLWDKTDVNLKNIRNVLDTIIYPQILKNFNDLQNDLQVIDKDISPLKNAIAQSRTEMNQSFKNLIAWFARMEDSEINDYEIKSAIDIVKNIFRKQENNLKINIDNMPYLKGKTLDSMVDIFFIIFDNAFKYSRLNDKTPITINIEYVDSMMNIYVTNEIQSSSSIDELNGSIDIIRLNYGTTEATLKTNKEGRSGFNKIWKILTKDLQIPEHLLNFGYVQNSNNPDIIEFYVDLKINVKGLVV